MQQKFPKGMQKYISHLQNSIISHVVDGSEI